MTVITAGNAVDCPVTCPYFVPHLKAICVRTVAAEFRTGVLAQVPGKYHKQIIELLPLDLALELAGSEIVDEGYWQRRCESRWANCGIVQHGNSWKQLYFERNVQDALEEFDSEVCSIDELKRMLAYSSKFVQGLNIEQLPSHLDWDIICSGLGNSLVHLNLMYGMRNVGMDYDRSIFGMKLSDCRSMARCLEYAETLTLLDLSHNMLDDDKARMLASGLINNVSVVHLDLSHNKIADRGVRAIAKVLHNRSVISVVHLQDNQIHGEGGRALARALRNNTSIACLNLRLNRLGEEGGRAIFDVLRQHPCMDTLTMSANSLGPVTAKSIAKFLSMNSVMKELDLANNELTEMGGTLIAEMASKCESLETCDLRLSGMSQTDIVAVQDMLNLRAEAQARKLVVGKKG